MKIFSGIIMSMKTRVQTWSEKMFSLQKNTLEAILPLKNSLGEGGSSDQIPDFFGGELSRSISYHMSFSCSIWRVKVCGLVWWYKTELRRCKTVKTLKCSGNTEAGPGYVTCSATDPAVALPNNKKIEVISDRKDFVQIWTMKEMIIIIFSSQRFQVTWFIQISALNPVDIKATNMLVLTSMVLILVANVSKLFRQLLWTLIYKTVLHWSTG